MRPRRSEISQLPATSSLLPPCSPSAHRQQAALPCRPLALPSVGHAFNARRPLLLSSQLRAQCCSALHSVAHSKPCGLVRHSRVLSWRARLLLAEAECACRRSSGRRSAAASVMQRDFWRRQRGSERGCESVAHAATPGGAGETRGTSGGDDLQADGWQPGAGVRPTPQQELLLLKLLSSPTHKEVLKKKIVMIAIGLHVDVTPVLEQQGLSLKWLEDVPDPSAILNDIQAYDHPLEEFWDNLSTLFEDGVKGRRKFLEQPAAAAKKGFGGGSANSGGGKGRKTKPRKTKSIRVLAAELAAKQELRRRQQAAAQAAAEDTILAKLMEDWTEAEKEAYWSGVQHWDVAMSVTLIGVLECLEACLLPESTVSLACSLKLLMILRAFVWRSIDLAQKRGNAPGRPVLDALQAMLARKAYDALQANFALRSSGEDAKWVTDNEDRALDVLAEETTICLPPPPAVAFVQPPNGGLCFVEEMLARQVAGSVNAWKALSLRERWERLLCPGWNSFAPIIDRSLLRLQGKEREDAANLLGLDYAHWLSVNNGILAADPALEATVHVDVVPEGYLPEAEWPTLAPYEPDESAADADVIDIAPEVLAAVQDSAAVLAMENVSSAAAAGATSAVADRPGLAAWVGLDPWVAAAASVGGAPYPQPGAVVTQPPGPVSSELSTAAEDTAAAEAAASVSVESPAAEAPSAGELEQTLPEQQASGAAGDSSAVEQTADADRTGNAAEEIGGALAEIVSPAAPVLTDQEQQSGRSVVGDESAVARADISDDTVASGDSAVSKSDGAGLPSGSGETAVSSQEALSGKEAVTQGVGASSPASSASSEWLARLVSRPVLPTAAAAEGEARQGGQGRQQYKREGSPSNWQQAPKQGRGQSVPRPVRRRHAVVGNLPYTAGTYMTKQLLPYDQRHWKAAGILLFSHAPDGSLLLLLGRIESAHSPATVSGKWRRQEGWWILGGKRDPTDFCAQATAVREMTEETAGILSGYHVCGDDLGEVLWYPPGSYAVFPYLLQGRLDIPRRYAKLRSMRGRVKGRRRFRQAGNPKPMSALSWVPLRDLVEGRCRLHWILEDMLRRTPLLPYLRQMEALGPPQSPARDPPPATTAPPAGRSGWTYSDGPARGLPPGRANARADWTSAPLNGAAKSGRDWWAPSKDAMTAHDMTAERPGSRWEKIAVAPSLAAPAVVDAAQSNGAAAAAAAAPEASPAPEADGLVRPRASEQQSYAAVERAAIEFLKSQGREEDEEGSQRETASAGEPTKSLLRPWKRRRPRLKRTQMKRVV